MLAGLATNCDIEKHSMFYRKNYMYPDMAKNFQTTQGPGRVLHARPSGPGRGRRGGKERYRLEELAEGESEGNITRTADGYTAHVGITRIHMEEDAGKMGAQSAAAKAASPAPRTRSWTTTAPARRSSSS